MEDTPPGRQATDPDEWGHGRTEEQSLAVVGGIDHSCRRVYISPTPSVNNIIANGT